MSSSVLFLVIAQCVSAEVFFSPSTRVVDICAGDNFTLTCVTNTGTLEWYRVGGYSKTFNVHLSNNLGPLGDHITVYPTNVSGSVITSVANIKRAPFALNGTVIQCRDSFGAQSVGFKTKTLLVSAITDLRFTALSFTSASIEWTVPTHCGNSFHIQIFFDSLIVYNTTSLTTSVNVNGLSRGVEYRVSVIGISDENRENEEMNDVAINMTLDVAEQVTDLVTRSLCYPNENTFILVSFKQASSSHPPAVRYIIRYSDSNDFQFQMTTNLTYTLIKAVPGRKYLIHVMAVNILGSNNIWVTDQKYYNCPTVYINPPPSNNANFTNISCSNVVHNVDLVYTTTIATILLLTLCTVNAVYISYRFFAYKRAKDRRRREGETERESGQQPKVAGVIYDPPKQAAGGKEFTMSNNTAYIRHEKTETENKE